MALPEPSEQRNPALSNMVWPGVILVAVAVYGYLTYRPPFESTRPKISPAEGYPEPPSPHFISAVQARLWEDPLEVIYFDRKRKGQQPAAIASRIASAGERPFTSSAEEAIVSDEAGAGSPLQDFFCEFADECGETGLLVVPVMVPGGPYAEPRETRRRIRYALLAALYQEGYSLSFPQRLSYVAVPVVVDMGKLMLYPFIAVLFMVLSRNQRLDDPGYPISLVFVMTLRLGSVLLAAVLLRFKANRARKRVRKRLQDQLLSLTGATSLNEQQVRERREQLNGVRGAFNREDRGTFRPFTQAWLFCALAIPFGGAGALALLERLLLS